MIIVNRSTPTPDSETIRVALTTPRLTVAGLRDFVESCNEEGIPGVAPVMSKHRQDRAGEPSVTVETSVTITYYEETK